jgi:phosphoribosylaminoimidazole-succinocarboxamide synthase
MVVHDLSIIPVEVVVRGYIAGSAWRDYTAGKPVSGITLPPGLKEFDRLPEPIITPYTKAPVGEHDLPISEAEIVRQGLATPGVWDHVRAMALALFSLATEELATRGLLFVDTKYEFGLLDGRVLLADEIHTLDSSRFWVAESYESRRMRGEAPEMLDKEPIRRWLMEQGFQGDGQIPELSDVYRRELMDHYLGSFRRITGRTLELDLSDPGRRLERNLQRHFGIASAPS